MTDKRQGTRVLKSEEWQDARVGSDAGLKALADAVFSYRYEDLAGPATGINPPGQASDPTVDLDGGWSFAKNATNTLVIVVQFRHKWVEGTGFEVHLHWEQPAAGSVLWRLEWKWYNNGDLVPESWETRDVTTGVFPYSTGTLGQISTFGEIESVKATSELFCAVGGEVIEVNSALTDAPDLVNSDPLNQGWMVKVKTADISPLDGLMDAHAYNQMIG